MADNLSELDDCISDVLKKFQLVSRLQFKLRQEQVIAVKILLSNRDAFAVLPTDYGKSLIFQCFVVAKELLEAKNGQGTPTSPCALVICPLTSIIEDQIVEAMSLGISCHRVQDIKELEQSAFQLVFSSAERVMEKDFKNLLKDSSSTLHNNVSIIVVDESHTVETWTGKIGLNISSSSVLGTETRKLKAFETHLASFLFRDRCANKVKNSSLFYDIAIADITRVFGEKSIVFLHFPPKFRAGRLGLLSINFNFRNVIFKPMVFPFVWAKYK